VEKSPPLKMHKHNDQANPNSYAGVGKNRRHPRRGRPAYKRDPEAFAEFLQTQLPEEQRLRVNAENLQRRMIGLFGNFSGYWRQFGPDPQFPDSPRVMQEANVKAVESKIRNVFAECDWFTAELLLARLWRAMIEAAGVRCSFHDWMERERPLHSWYYDYQKIFEGCPNVPFENLRGMEIWAESGEKRQVSNSLRRGGDQTET
jgi:hypothetical protein